MAVLEARAGGLRGRRSAARAIAGRTFADARVRTLSFAAMFAATSYAQPIGYAKAYPTLADRAEFARGLGADKAARLFYGFPHDLPTISGYSAWRVGGTIAIFASIWGALAAVRALRTEEESGRAELVRSAPVSPSTAFLSPIHGIAHGIALLWLATAAALVAGGLAAGGSAFLALSAVSVAPVFVGIGAVISQLAPTRRAALELSAAVVGLFLLIRVAADTVDGLLWMHWLTPLGWAEELRPFTGAQPVVLLLPLAATSFLLIGAAKFDRSRDLGSGLIRASDNARANLRLLSSTTAAAFRATRMNLLIWVGGVGALAFVLGVFSHTVTALPTTRSVTHTLQRLGVGSQLTPSAYLGFTFIFIVLAASLYCCAQVSAAAHEESGEQLETLLALPVSRRRWLTGRLVLAVGGAAAVSIGAGVMAWAGATSSGASASLPRMLEAGVNCMPACVLFLGLSAVGYAVVPRAAAGVGYGMVTAAFLWNLFGSLLSAPRWAIDLSPFVHVGLVPAQPMKVGAALVMAAIGLGCLLLAPVLFTRRDLAGA